MKYSEMPTARHLVSVASWTFITLNLLIWLPFLLLAAFVRFVCPVNAVKVLTDNLVDEVYRIATRIDGGLKGYWACVLRSKTKILRLKHCGRTRAP